MTCVDPTTQAGTAFLVAVVVTFKDLHVYAYIGQRTAEREGVNIQKPSKEEAKEEVFGGNKGS